MDLIFYVTLPIFKLEPIHYQNETLLQSQMKMKLKGKMASKLPAYKTEIVLKRA